MYPRWIWRAFALPGVGWLIAFFLVAFYSIVATSFGFADDVGDPIPVWNPLNWNVGWFSAVFEELGPGRHLLDGVPADVRRTSSRAASLSLLIGYPVAYYVARRGGRRRGPAAAADRAAVLDLVPDADVRVGEPARRRRLCDAPAVVLPDRHAVPPLGLLDQGAGWLDGQPITVVLALVYGYVPFLILPVYASLDRIDQRVIEAARDLGVSPSSAFRRVTLPLSMPGILGGLVLIALPMFGDYYTPDLISSSPSTNMIGNQIDLRSTAAPRNRSARR